MFSPEAGPSRYGPHKLIHVHTKQALASLALLSTERLGRRYLVKTGVACPEVLVPHSQHNHQ
jgi:hypothetical protein